MMGNKAKKTCDFTEAQQAKISAALKADDHSLPETHHQDNMGDIETYLATLFAEDEECLTKAIDDCLNYRTSQLEEDFNDDEISTLSPTMKNLELAIRSALFLGYILHYIGAKMFLLYYSNMTSILFRARVNASNSLHLTNIADKKNNQQLTKRALEITTYLSTNAILGTMISWGTSIANAAGAAAPVVLTVVGTIASAIYLWADTAKVAYDLYRGIKKAYDPLYLLTDRIEKLENMMTLLENRDHDNPSTELTIKQKKATRVVLEQAILLNRQIQFDDNYRKYRDDPVFENLQQRLKDSPWITKSSDCDRYLGQLNDKNITPMDQKLLQIIHDKQQEKVCHGAFDLVLNLGFAIGTTMLATAIFCPPLGVLGFALCAVCGSIKFAFLSANKVIDELGRRAYIRQHLAQYEQTTLPRALSNYAKENALTPQRLTVLKMLFAQQLTKQNNDEALAATSILAKLPQTDETKLNNMLDYYLQKSVDRQMLLDMHDKENIDRISENYQQHLIEKGCRAYIKQSFFGSVKKQFQGTLYQKAKEVVLSPASFTLGF